MQTIRTAEQEALEDIFFGQLAVIWARWFLILAGGIVILWSADQLGGLVVGVIAIAAMMAMNFYLHGRYIVEKPVNARLIQVTCVLDLAIITLLLLFWPVEKRIDNQFFVFYYPVVLAFAFVMNRRLALSYTLAAVVIYFLVTFPFLDFNDPVLFQKGLKHLILRAIALAAVGWLGTYYWRIQRDRRRAAIKGSQNQ